MDVAINILANEEDFIAACVRKERWAQQKLYEDNYSNLMGVCLRYASDENEALDILHEGFIKIFRYISKYEAGTSLSAWLRRIMINTAIDCYRKNVRRRTENLDQIKNVATKQPSAISNIREREILDAVQLLSPAYRMVFNMYIIEGFSHKEIGESLGITESSSRSNLVKARNKLKEILRLNGNVDE